MTNDLRKLSKDLKAFAKRCKDFKYTEQMLFVFLLCGILGFSDVTPTDKAIQTKRQEISTSIGDMRQEFKKVKSENDKLVKNYNLELIQLMEQGDQAVKSPWSNWQYGMNFFYNDWQGKYKGRGDKTENIKYKRDANSKFGTFDGGKYGTTALNNKVIEPISAVPVDAAVKPKNIDKQPPTFTVAGADGGFPNFETRTVPSITKIKIDSPAQIRMFTPPALNFVGTGFGQADGIGRIGDSKYLTVSSSVVIENFETYNANNFVAEMTNSASNATGGSLTASVTAKEGGKSWSIAPAGTVYINSPETFASKDAFINDLRPRDVNYNGDYTFKTNSTGQKIFISYNPAGFYNGTERSVYAPGASGWTGFGQHYTSSLNGDLNIESNGSGITIGVEHQLWNSSTGTTADLSNGYSTWLISNNGKMNLRSGKQIVGIMIDIESQADDRNGLRKKNNEQTINRGTITVGTGNNTTTQSIGIDFGDYAASPTIPVDVELGNIIVNDSENYGFRMRNLQRNATANTYYNDVTVSGGNGKISVYGTNNVGLAIQKSLSDDVKESQNASGTIAVDGIYTVAGNKNYERLIGDNPISNYISLNVDVKGHENVGILRMSGYSNNNTNDFIFFDTFTDNAVNSQTGNIGTFDIGNLNNTPYVDAGKNKTRHGATNNILLRTDNHGIQNQGTITINGSNGGYVTYVNPSNPAQTIEEAAGNIVMLANGAGQKVINYGTINQTNAGLKNTVGLVAYSGGSAKNGVLIAADANNAANHNRRTKNDTARTNDMIGKIEMAGAGSIGLYVTNGSTGENSGEIKLTSTDGRNVGIYNAGTTTLTGAVLTTGTSDGKVEVTGKNSVGLYNVSSGTTNIKLSDTTSTKALNVNVIGNNGGSGIYAAGGTVTADDSHNAITNPSSTNGELKIKVLDTAGTDKGVGVYADGNAAVTLKHSDIDVNNGTGAGGGGIYALGNSNVNVEGATVKYNGEGYAFYTENSGHINADNSKVTLDGKAVGFNVIGSGSGYTTNVSLNNSKIDINSNDVILLGVQNPISHKLSDFDTVLLSGSGVALANIGGTATDFKIAVLDGINNGKSFNIDQVLDKSEAVSPTSLSTATQSYKYVRNLLLQRSIIDVNADVKAELSSSDATAMQSPNGAVVGLYVTATPNASNNSETGINVNNITITSDRTDAGAGAIGLYTDYGKINVSNGSTLDIEMNKSNTVNEKAVGVYAVNGSVINNEGTVNVGGDKSIGLLGLSYRQDSSGKVVGNEFGNGDEGVITVKNDGKLNLDGEGAKGILVFNNSSKAPTTYTDSNGTVITLPSNITSVSSNTATNDTNGIITLTGEKAVGIYADEATATNKGIIDLQGAKSQIGIYGTTTSGIAGRDSVLTNDTSGTIKVGNSTLASNTDIPNIGIFTESSNQVTNKGKITVGDNSYGIYAKNIKESGTSELTVNKNGVGIFAVGETTNPGNVTIDNGAKITVNNGTPNKEGVAVFTGGNNTVNVTDNGSIMDLKDSSFGFVLKAPGTFVNSNTGSATLANDAIYAYTDNNTVNITNYTPLTSTGDRNYGLYGNGTIENHGNIDFSTGNGNVGIYSTGGIATNYANIKVGASNTAAKEYGVGMATGYYDDTPGSPTHGQTFNQGTVINRGTIEVSQPNTMGMYAVGSGSKAINYDTINLSGSNTIGMYIDRGATGENWGTIQTTASGLTSVKGIYVANGSYVKNYGTINIAASDPKSAGIWTDTQSVANVDDTATGVNPITGVSQTGTSTPRMKVVTADDMKEMGGITIKVPPRMTPPTVTDAQGNVIPIFKVDTDVAAPAPTTAIVTSPSGITSINLATSNLLNFPSASEATSMGMYVDTSGVNYTNPIQGLSNLAGLTDVNLFFGTEAARYTTARAIEVGDNILKPYNDALSGVVTAGTTLNVTAASLTWMAQPTKNAATGLLDKVYLVKIPYTLFAKKGDTQTYNFLAGLEQKYGQEGVGTREKAVFDKINSLNGGEGHILAQAIDEMKGHQYSNIQQRTKETGDILSQEFNYLKDEWRNPTKDNNKIKMFGHRGEYNTDTAGVVDYTDNAYGVAYVHENETVKLGRKSGWYAGAVTNRFEFKDLGKSKETQTMIKAGLFKTVSPYNDHNGSLTWTIAGEAFAGVNNMTRRYWIVDDTFEAKSDYTTYGVALKNEIGKDFRTSERTSIRPYGALNLEYGRYSNIKEDGPMALEVKGNDYFSVQPELGVAFNYSQPVGVKSHFKASLTAAYTNELGEVNDVRNKAKLKGTTADYYELRGDKEDRKGNGKFDLNIGFDNTRFGVTVNAGYDTKGENIRGGIGFRAIY